MNFMRKSEHSYAKSVSCLKVNHAGFYQDIAADRFKLQHHLPKLYKASVQEASTLYASW